MADSIGGFHGFPIEVAIAAWLLCVIWLLFSACSTDGSHEFRLRFLPGFLLVWTLFLGFFSFIILAWISPITPLYSRLDSDGSWIVPAMPFFIILELILIVGITIWFIRSALKKGKS